MSLRGACLVVSLTAVLPSCPRMRSYALGPTSTGRRPGNQRAERSGEDSGSMGEARAGMSDEAGEFEDLVRDVYANGGRLGEKLGIHFSEISVERLVATMPVE